MSFSVLMSIYYKEKPEYLEVALKSLVDQTLRASEVILVEDGHISDDLRTVINKYRIVLNILSVPLPENVGLACALNEGLKYCKNELVARMDTDDYSVPNRFEKQVNFMLQNSHVSVSSGYIEEWNQDLTMKIAERVLPVDHASIIKFAKKRSPISHPAVIFRKSAILSVGGYPSIYPEDYPLWVKMLVNDHVFANIPEVLLLMRLGDALSVRRGKDFLKGEVATFGYLYDVGFINRFEFFSSIFARSFLRLSPLTVKKFLYKYFR